MSFAGHDHIAIFIINDASRPPGHRCDECRHDRRNRRLRLLAAEPAAHSLALTNDLVHRQTERFGDNRLGFGRILCRRNDLDRARFAGYCDACLRFEVKLFLAAGTKGRRKFVWRTGKRRLHITPANGTLGADIRFRSDRIVNRQNRLLWLVFNDHRLACPTYDSGVFGSDNDDRLADVHYRIAGQERFVMKDRPE